MVVVTPGSTTADVSWDNIDDVTFNLRYRIVGSSTWTEVTSAINATTVMGLNILTNYELEINSDCGTSQSPYSTTVFFTTTDITYCTPIVDFYADDFYISNVKIDNASAVTILDNTSNENDDVNGYSDHTNGLAIPDLMAGDSFDISITLLNTHPWNKTTGHSVWIDYNQDGNFDDTTERVWGTTAGDDLFAHGALAQGSFNVSTAALVGNTVMRIASRTYFTPEDSCHLEFDANNGGEFEDYTVNILNPTLSTTDVDASNIIIYPNPVTESLNIKLPATFNNSNLTIQLLDKMHLIEINTIYRIICNINF